MKTAIFLKKLSKATTEEEVKHLYMAWLRHDVIARNHIDCRTGPIVWEFKYNINMQLPAVRARILAQAAYYVRSELTCAKRCNIAPTHVICADRNELFIIEVQRIAHFINDSTFNWRLRPSSPDPRLVEALEPVVCSTRIYVLSEQSVAEVENLKQEIERIIQCTDKPVLKRVITSSNALEVFRHWADRIGRHMLKHIDILYAIFIKDLSGDPINVHYDARTGRLRVAMHDGDVVMHVPESDYVSFWDIWHRPPTAMEYARIIMTIDRLKDDRLRALTGSYYTPTEVVQLQTDIMRDILGKTFEQRFSIWDPACGTGNLFAAMVETSRCYLSTIDPNEIDVMKRYRLVPDASMFVYDYLEHDVERYFMNNNGLSVPESLARDLATGNVIILMNPPFLTSGGKNYTKRAQTAANSASLPSASSVHRTAVERVFPQRFNIPRKVLRNIGVQFIIRSMAHGAKYIFSYLPQSFIHPKLLRVYGALKYEIVPLFAAPGRLFSDIERDMSIYFAMFKKIE